MNFKKVVGFSLIGYYIYSESMRRNNEPPVFVHKKLINNYNGYVLPGVGIFIKESEKNNLQLLDHEYIHWKQFQREGAFPFLLNYIIEAIGKGYDQNKYEIEARANENDWVKLNYTEAVRNGLAKTAFNPDFRK